MANDLIQVQSAPLDTSLLWKRLHGDPACGAVVTFSGLVRDHNLGNGVAALTLEHYPGMTEAALANIVEDARQRWVLGAVAVVHRVGTMQPGDTIVFVGVSSTHRHSAFEAAEYVMDRLKTEAPFWKKEKTDGGLRWVEARSSDVEAVKRWRQE